MTERYIPRPVQGTPEAQVVMRGTFHLTPEASPRYALNRPIFPMSTATNPTEYEPIAPVEPVSDDTTEEIVKLLTQKRVTPEKAEKMWKEHAVKAYGKRLEDLPAGMREGIKAAYSIGVPPPGTETEGAKGQQAKEAPKERPRPQEPLPSVPDEILLARAHEVSPHLGAISISIKRLWDEVMSGALPKDKFNEKAGAIRKELNEALKRQPNTEGMPDSQRDKINDEYNFMQFQLGYEITKMMKQYEPKNNEDQKKKIELLQNLDEFREGYRELDALIAEAEGGARRATWYEDYEAAYQKIDDYIESIDYSSPGAREFFADIARESLAENRIAKEHYGYGLEYAIERIIGQGDVNPTGDYPQFGLYMQGNLDDLVQSARKYNEGFFGYLYHLRGKRALAHEVFKNMKDRRTFVGIVANSLDPGGMQFIEEQVGGVSDVQILIEQELGRMAAMNSYEGKGWILHDQFRDVVDKRISEMVNDPRYNLQRQVREWVKDPLTNKWTVKVVEGADGRPVTRNMRKWEKSRADRMAASVSAAALRRQTYGVIGDTPDRISERVETVEGGEEIMTIAQPLKLVDERYFVFQPGSRRYLKNWHERKNEEASRIGAEYGGMKYSLERNGKKYGIFGASERATVLMDTGTADVKSSMWRVDLMLFQQRDYANVEYNGSNLTIGEYLVQVRKDIAHAVEHDPRFAGKPEHTIHHEIEHRYNHAIEHTLEQQRLFVGALLRRGDISIENKQKMWENSAELLPSRIASIMPQFSMDEVKAVYGNNETLAKEKWDDICRKLFVMEYRRVQDDAEGLRVDSNRQRVHPNYVPRSLESYFAESGMDQNELAVARRWQQLGRDMSHQLAQIVWPTTPFLNDTPKTKWNNMGRDELKRLLVNDHNDWENAYKGIHGLIANPAQDMEKVTEIMHAFIESAKSPTSLVEAQQFGESFIVTYAKMATKYNSAKWTANLPRLFRRPTSQMEEFNLQAGISYDEETIAAFLYGLAHHEIIADDLSETNEKGQTQLIRLAGELDADKLALIMMRLRLLLLIFPGEFLEEIFQALMPEEIIGKL